MYNYPKPIWDTPEQERIYQEAMAEIESSPAYQKMRKDIEDSQRITDEDLRIVINAR